MTKFELIERKHKLAANEAKLYSTETRLSSLEVMMDDFINTTGCSNKLTSSAQWSFQLNAVAVKDFEATHICSVIMNIPIDQKRIAWYGDPFYSRGHKMCLYIYFVGVGPGKGTHLSIYVRLMNGPYDDELTWPMKGKFDVKLLNQISDWEHHSEIMNYDEVDDDATNRVINCSSGGFYQFISNKDLYKVTPTCQYVKNDSNFF